MYSYLSPIEKHDEIWFKRDDLFMPYVSEENYVNGGKLRQALSLFEELGDKITREYNGGIMTATSVFSPQGAILSTVARKNNVKCFIGVGNTTEEKVSQNDLLQYAIKQGASVKILANIGYDSVLLKRLQDIQKENGYFIVRFGINYKLYKKSIFDVNSEQVQNLPDDLDYLIIPVGSAITMTGILLGIEKYKKNIKHIIGVQVGANRSQTLQSYLPFMFPIQYTLVKTTISYKRKIIYDKPFPLDPIYEAKAYRWMRENLNMNKNICFWIVGNQRLIYDNEVRKKCYIEV